MIPATGWLDEADNANHPPDASRLPIALEVSYGDGPQGDYNVETLEDPTFNYRLVVTGSVGMQTTAGLIGTDLGFLATMSQLDVYGVLLMDMLDPPDAIPAPEPADVPVPEVEPCPSNDNILTIDACCGLMQDWIFDGSVVFNGTRKFGAIP